MKKKIFSLVLIAVMVLASVSTAFAGSITVTPQDEGSHTYTAYQIITGTIEKENNTYTYADPVWGKDVTKSTDGKVTIGGKAYTAQEFLNAFKEGELSADDAAAIEAVVTGGTSSTNNKIDGLADGYYLVKDTGTISGEMSATKYILINVKNENRTIKSKSSVPTVEKKVQDINESTETGFGELQDSADHKIGKIFPYTVTATMGDGVEKYDNYYIAFVDNMSNGLEMQLDSISIKYNGTDITSAFTRTQKGSTITAKDGTKLDSTEYTWECADLVAVVGHKLAKNDKVVLTYNAKLTADAVVGKPGNPNDVKLLFDNDPNNSGKGTPGETPEDRNVVFTYNVDINKVDQDGKSLAGAKFKLEKYDASVEGENKWVLVKEYTLGTETTFSFHGLDDGNYRLTETEAPKNYNKLAAPIEFTITANHETDSANPDLIELKWSRDENNHASTVTEGDTTLVTGCFEDDVENQQGAVLPETGGMGTTIIYILGAALVIGAGVVLVSRKKMSDR